MAEWRDMMRQAETEASSPLKPQMIVRRFGDRMAKDAILTTDSGQNTELAARHIDLGAGNAFAVSGALASMSCGLSYAIAAGIAYPGRQVCAVVGDGGMAMQLGEFSTAVRYGIPLKLLVIKNNMLNQIAWEQMMFLGNPQFGCELQPIDFAKAAEAMGGKGFSVGRPEDIDAALDAAFAESGPVIVEALVDRYVPMLPPKVPPDYRQNFRKALAETPGQAEIEENVAREPFATMMNG
jgi:pyruvate dehydrogenase (quinone)